MPLNVQCKRCANLNNHWCNLVIDSPDEDMVRDCRHYRTLTNADRIRSMTDEELAELLTAVAKRSAEELCKSLKTVNVDLSNCDFHILHEAHLDWLKSEVQNE